MANGSIAQPLHFIDRDRLLDGKRPPASAPAPKPPIKEGSSDV